MSRTPFCRPVYTKPPTEMVPPKDKLLKIIRPVYEMPKSPMHWIKTFFDYGTEKLIMLQTSLDPCLMYASSKDRLDSIIGI